MSRLVVALAAVLALFAAATAAAQPRTTVERSILDRDGDNRLEPAPGEDHVVRAELGAPPSDDRARTRERLVFFGQMSDTHVIDEESPLRVEFTDQLRGPFTSAYRPQEGLSPQVLNEMVEQIRNTTSPVPPARPIELVMTTGDNTDNSQCNETRWMIDTMDGRTTVNPDSGLLAGATGPAGRSCTVVGAPAVPTPPTCTARATADDRYDGPRGDRRYYEPDSSKGEDGPGYSPRQAENGRSSEVRDFPGLFQEMNEPFRATGLKDLPWYAVFGNHDGLIQGNQPRNPAFEAYATGCVKVTNLAAADLAAIQQDLEDDPTGAAALARLQQALLATANDPANAGTGASTVVVPPDANRRPLRKNEWIAEHFVTQGVPLGHGFGPQNISSGEGYYSFNPKPGVRFIALDTIAETGLEEGNVGEVQFRWLESQLEQAEAAEEYVMVFAHHSLETMGQPPVSPFPPGDTGGQQDSAVVHYGNSVRGTPAIPCDSPTNAPGSTTETVRCLLLRNPSVVAFVNGHEHNHRIDPIERRQGTGPVAGGFWEINTASHIDWAQQSRVLDLFDNKDGTLSIFTTVLDHQAPPNPGGPDAPREGQGLAATATQRLASISRELAFNDTDARHDDNEGEGGGRGSREDRNVELLIRDPYAD
jgi:3',5'-cyclic AMP phosphodiesterase CpdA